MTKEYTLESIVAVDCGSVWTRALLIDVVEGRYRLIARGEALSTTRQPHANAMLGVARAITQIETYTGRQLLDNKAQLITPERPDGNGVDAFVATASAAEPLRAFLVGLTNDVSLSSARRALAGANASIAGILSVADKPNSPAGVERTLEQFLNTPADVAIIVGGTDGSNSDSLLDLASLLALAYEVAEPSRRPPIIFAGNSAVSSAIASVFGSLAEVKIVANVRPSMDVENLGPLSAELLSLYADARLLQAPGMSAVAGWTRLPLMPTARAQDNVLRYLSAHYDMNIVSLEWSATRAAVSWAMQGNTGAITDPSGVSAGVSIAERVGLDNLMRWLPTACEPTTVWNTLRNLNLYPGVAPGAAEELALLQALAHEALTPIVARARADWRVGSTENDPTWDLIILSGATLTGMPQPGQAALLALNALQPVGVSGLVLDATPLSPALGAVAALEPVAAAQVLDQDGFVSLGTVIAPHGRGRPGETAMSVKITYADGRTLQMDVPAGALEVIPLEPGQKATLQLRPGRGFNLGWSSRRRKATVEVDGGMLGIVVDTRGRPLPAPTSVAAAQEHMRQWLWEIGG